MSVIDDYLKGVSEPQRQQLERIRETVKKLVPDAKEVISYGMPVFKYKGKYLIGFAAFKNHMSVFPGAAPIRELKDKLTSFNISKGTIQFTLENPLVEPLIEEIILLSLETSVKR